MIAQLKHLLPHPTLPGYDLPPVPQAGTRVLLLRHGRSTLNDEGRYQGNTDTGELTAAGVVASKSVGRYLAYCPIAAVYTSPLKRAQQTISALIPQLKVPLMRDVVTTALLEEIHLPAWEGLPYGDVKLRYPDLYQCWQEHPEQFQMTSQANSTAPTPFYPVRDVYQRAQQFWQSVLPHHPGQTILVVGHGSSNQALINTALGLSPSQHHALQQTHSGLTILDFVTPIDRAAKLHVLNTTPGDRLPKLKAGKQGLRLLLLPYHSHRSTPMKIASFLKRETIDAAIVEDGDDTESRRSRNPLYMSAESALQHHPETVVLSVHQMQLSQQWEAAIQRSLTTYHHSHLTTLLVVARSATLQAGFNSLMRLPDSVATPKLRPNCLSVIHYTKTRQQPILQGVNLIPMQPRA